jgi:hypothetical protein
MVHGGCLPSAEREFVWLRRRRTRDDPDDANADYCKRNKIGKQRVAHRLTYNSN